VEAYFWDYSDIPSSGNLYWTDTAREGGCLDIDDPVFRQHLTNYKCINFGFCAGCDSKETCDCEGLNCLEAESTVRYAAAAATTAKSLGITLNVEVPPALTPTEIDADTWHW